MGVTAADLAYIRKNIGIEPHHAIAAKLGLPVQWITPLAVGLPLPRR